MPGVVAGSPEGRFRGRVEVAAETRATTMWCRSSSLRGDSPVVMLVSARALPGDASKHSPRPAQGVSNKISSRSIERRLVPSTSHGTYKLR